MQVFRVRGDGVWLLVVNGRWKPRSAHGGQCELVVAMNALNKSGFLERTAAASGILGRRGFVVLAAGILQAGGILSARGEDLAASDKAAAFMAETGGKLVGVINGQAQAADKRSALAQIVDDRFDVGGIARFSLGRFWHTATTEQQTLFLTEFRQAVVTNIVAKLGEAPGTSFDRGCGPATRRCGGDCHRPAAAESCGCQFFTGLSAGPPTIRKSSTGSSKAPHFASRNEATTFRICHITAEASRR